MNIKKINKLERPREKALKNGIETLNNTELLAIIIKSGIKNKNVLKLSKEVLKKHNENIQNIKMESLETIKGIGKTKAIEIIASIELEKE